MIVLFIGLSLIGCLVLGLLYIGETRDIPLPNDGIYSHRLSEVVFKYDIKINSVCNIKDTPVTIRLIEIDEKNENCKIELYNSRTNEVETLLMNKNQQVKGLIVSRIASDSITIDIPGSDVAEK